MVLDQLLAARFDALGLVPKEARALDHLFEAAQRHFRQFMGGRVLREQFSGHDVHPLVSALRRKNCGDQQF